MDARHSLSHEMAVFNQIKDRLKILHNLDAEDDAEILSDTSAGECNIEESIVDVLREAKATEAMAKGLSGRIDDMQSRKARLDAKAERLRAIGAWALQECGLSKLTAPDLTASLRAGKPKLVIEEGALAAEFLKQVVTSRPDRDAIQAAVDGGNVPEGVSVTNGQPVLTLRVK